MNNNSTSKNALSDYTHEIDPVFENDFHPDVVDEFIRITCDPSLLTEDDPNVKLAAAFFCRAIDKRVIEQLIEISMRRKLHNKPTRKSALRKKFWNSK